MDKYGCGSSRLWKPCPNIKLDDVILLVFNWYRLMLKWYAVLDC